MNNIVDIVKVWFVTVLAINIDVVGVNKTLELVAIILGIIYSIYKLYISKKSK